MSSSPTLPYHQILNRNQALISEDFKKSLESRALLDHYKASQMRRVIDERQAMDEKQREMEFSKMQNERHHQQMERKRMIKENKKYQYSMEYEQEIEMRKQREKYEKLKQLWLQQRVLDQQKWLLDVNQQKEIEKLKKMQYGKQLERHLKMQQQKRINEANKIKQQRQRLKRQAEEAAKKQQFQNQMKYRRKSMIEYRNSQIEGVKDALNWSTTNQSMQYENSKQPLTPRMDHMLKIQQRRFYDKGRQAEYKSETQKRYFEKQNPEQTQEQQKSYNPITNPIPYKYKNPNILKLLSDYS